MLGSAKRLLPMAVLYGGRIGVAALGLVILPWLSRRMPAEEFGLAATVLSLQSLAVVLDLGLSVTIAREFPSLTNAHDQHALIRRNERVLLLLYIGITTIIGVLAMIGALPISVLTALLACFSLLLIVWQNFIVVSFISQQRYLTSTISQFSSLLLRHCCSLILVIFLAGTLQAFVIGQVLGAAAVLAASRYAFVRLNRSDDPTPSDRAALPATSVAIILYTVAGACAMQLDKVLLSALSSPIDTGSYFLASTLSLVPITFLASPVSQFVQPKLIACLAHGQERAARRWIVRLTLAIIGFAVLPGIALGLAAPWLVPLWLHGSPQQETVSHYVTLLMPGSAFSALGLVPAIVLITRRDYRVMAAISCMLAAVVLTTTALLAARGAIGGVCVAYAIYHVLATVALWWRAWRIEPSFANAFAIRPHIANDGAEQADRIRA